MVPLPIVHGMLDEEGQESDRGGECYTPDGHDGPALKLAQSKDQPCDTSEDECHNRQYGDIEQVHPGTVGLTSDCDILHSFLNHPRNITCDPKRYNGKWCDDADQDDVFRAPAEVYGFFSDHIVITMPTHNDVQATDQQEGGRQPQEAVDV